jgi:hypothetical protein
VNRGQAGKAYGPGGKRMTVYQYYESLERRHEGRRERLIDEAEYMKYVEKKRKAQ